jgi:hypothetical protein
LLQGLLLVKNNCLHDCKYQYLFARAATWFDKNDENLGETIWMKWKPGSDEFLEIAPKNVAHSLSG